MAAAIVQVVLDALSVGGLYALTALGIGLVFSVMRLANFAHSELITGAAYVILVLATQSLALALAGAVVASVVLALLTERAAFRTLRTADPATLLISSFAVSMLLQKSMVFAFGSRAKGLNLLPVLNRQIGVMGVSVQILQVVSIAICATSLLALTLFLKRSRFGLQMRAAAEDFRMARLVGVRANGVIATAFGVSGALAAIVAVLFVAQTGLVQPRLGVTIVIVAFVGTVIGGLGSLVGAAAGGFLVGAGTTLLQTLLPPDLRVFREAFVFLLVILVLLARPQGLFPARGLRGRV